MAAKEVKFSTEVREEMLRGHEILSNAVKVTLGPTGRYVILGKSFGAPRISKDGVTIAKIVSSAGKKADIGAGIRQIKTDIEETTSDYDRISVAASTLCVRRLLGRPARSP